MEVETYLLGSIKTVPDQQGPVRWYRNSFRLMRLADAVPAAGLMDLVVAALDASGHSLLPFNRFLSPASLKLLHEGVLTWLQLCVLQDRLSRLEALAMAGQEYQPLLIQASSSVE